MSRRRCHAAVLLAAVLFAAAMVVTTGRPIRLPAGALARRIDSSTMITRSTSTVDDDDTTPPRRRWLVGPGSSPPTCQARCGRCTPCRATRVAIHSEVGPQWEYYPEVWRCKCGNKLSMP
ncbi:EPIDERMAL PATTERNING FACTOR-like protein 6 [Phragmites australis]|uniref:EPIDERMAL PATTERNING FACTOR-like protein 6 n=1 Tax=Phragmites australis TaxID=29695 RepID=UPI002D76D96C|nr:EPIDERMAL PATTERNING FACTOR-like protein 6 [Phragmites australis]